MTEAETIARATRAAALLADPLLKESLETIERDVVEAIFSCPVRDTEGLQILQTQLRLARQFKGILQGAIEKGKLCAHDLREKETFMNRAKGAFSRLS